MGEMSSSWIDLTMPIRADMPTWPDNPGISLTPSQCLAHGDVCNVSQLSMGTHTGTHVDGLNHFIKDAPSVAEMPVELMVGSVTVIEITHHDQITQAELEKARIEKGGRYFFKTRNSHELHPKNTFDGGFVHIAEDAAAYLAEKEVALIGVDYLSVGGFEGNVIAVHHALLGNGIWCVEGLDLREVQAGAYEVVVAPLKLGGGDGGAARVLARKEAA